MWEMGISEFIAGAFMVTGAILLTLYRREAASRGEAGWDLGLLVLLVTGAILLVFGLLDTFIDSQGNDTAS